MHKKYKNPLFVLTMVFFCGFLAVSCDPTSLTPGPVIEAPYVSLNVDGDNQTAPLFGGGTYEAAVRFTPAATTDLVGGKLIEVYYYIRDLPTSCTVRIYKKSANNSPSILVYSEATTSELEGEAWNRHILSTPVEIDNQDLWIGIRFQHGGQQQTMGCDPGPADVDGDWFFDNADNSWVLMYDRTNSEININWNIRGVVEPK